MNIISDLSSNLNYSLVTLVLPESAHPILKPSQLLLEILATLSTYTTTTLFMIIDLEPLLQFHQLLHRLLIIALSMAFFLSYICILLYIFSLSFLVLGSFQYIMTFLFSLVLFYCLNNYSYSYIL